MDEIIKFTCNTCNYSTVDRLNMTQHQNVFTHSNDLLNILAFFSIMKQRIYQIYLSIKSLQNDI